MRQLAWIEELDEKERKEAMEEGYVRKVLSDFTGLIDVYGLDTILSDIGHYFPDIDDMLWQHYKKF